MGRRDPHGQWTLMAVSERLSPKFAQADRTNGFCATVITDYMTASELVEWNNA